MATTVLVVEDDLEINELIGEYLSLESIRYVKATSGNEGLHLAETEHPDAIILDLMLPGIDGFEVVRQLSRHRATYDIPVIILSCMCQICDREKAYASGAHSFINKPFLPDDLLAGVRNALAWKAELKKRPPSQSIALWTECAGKTSAATNGQSAPKDATACTRAINQMIADLFTQTDLTDAGVAGIREGAELVATWAAKWNAEHAQPSHVTLDYRIKPRVMGDEPRTGAPLVEWTLHEDAPGILADAFFKPVANGSSGGMISALIGWGGSGTQAKTLAMPPTKWLQLLTKTGASSFEKDPVSHDIKFTRTSPGTVNAVAASAPMALNGTR